MIHHISSILILAVLPCAELSTLQGLVERQVRFQNQTETFAGRIYLKFPDHLFLSIYSPLDQVVISQRDTTIIYFPAVGKAFRSLGRNPFDSELAGSLFRAQTQWNLTDIGYTLAGEEPKGDTLVRRWLPEEGAIIGAVVVKESEERVVGIEIFDKEGRRIVTTHYTRFLRSGELSIPTRIVSFSPTDGDTLYEKITYRRLKLNQEIPDSILNFRLPQDVKIFEE